MIATIAALTVVVGAWSFARWFGKGRPCPTAVAALFDNPLVSRLSGVETLLRRADVRSGMRVLDAGCGPGRLTIPLARRVEETGEVVALDVQQGMLDRVRRNVERARVENVRLLKGALEGNAAILRHESEGFDRILMVTVLGEIPDQAGALAAVHGALKPQGLLSVTETIIDPDYVSERRLVALATGAGFKLKERYGSALAFTLNFGKVA